MPKIKSQIKRMKRAQGQSVRNRHVKSTLKTYMANFSKAVDDRDIEGAKEAKKIAFRALDQAARKGIIHSNNAANKKARMSKKFNDLSKATT